MVDRIKVISQDDDKTVLRVLVTPFGDAKNLDLDGEYFNSETDFGDSVLVPLKTSFYEHGVNTVNNPHMKTTKQVLGTGHLVEVDDWGRWYEFEIKRSLEYHDYLLNMVDMKIMGASSGCHLNMKENGDPNLGEDPKWIKTWYEAEPSLTPTPAHPFTLGQNSVTEETISKVNTAIKSFNVDHLFKELTLESMADATPTSEGESESGEEANQDNPELGIDQEIEGILNGDGNIDLPDEGESDSESHDLAVDEVAKSLATHLQPAIQKVVEEQMKISFDMWINLWGYGEDSSPRDAIQELLGVGKSYKSNVETQNKALRAIAKGIVNFSPKDVLKELNSMSEAEKKAFESLPDPEPIKKSVIPDNAPGS